MEAMRRAFSFNAIISIYILGFFLTLYHTIPVYINSSFLSATIGEKFIGFLYTGGSILSIIGLLWIPKLLRSYGEYKTFLVLIALNIFSLIGLILDGSPVFVAASFILNFAAATAIAFNTDILLENYTKNENTGGIRGMFLTMANVAWLISPILATSILAGTTEYWRIYSVSFLFLIPVIYILRHRFQKFRDPSYHPISISRAVSSLAKNKDTRMIFMASFLMQFFFSWMVIYMPIYLHEHIGFSWDRIGLLLSIALLPYILLEAPLGKLADTKWGEKEILSIGFVVVALSTVSLSFIEGANFAVWAALLFLTRVGGSMLEIMSETHFFKIIETKDVDTLSFFRMTRPLAYVIGPLIASITLLFTGYKGLFFLLGILMLYGLRYSLAIRDTK